MDKMFEIKSYEMVCLISAAVHCKYLEYVHYKCLIPVLRLSFCSESDREVTMTQRGSGKRGLIA